MAVSRKKSHGSSAKPANISAKSFSKAWFPPSKNKHTPETVGWVLAYSKEDLTTSELRIDPKPGLWKFNKFLGFGTTQADQKQTNLPNRATNGLSRIGCRVSLRFDPLMHLGHMIHNPCFPMFSQTNIFQDSSRFSQKPLWWSPKSSWFPNYVPMISPALRPRFQCGRHALAGGGRFHGRQAKSWGIPSRHHGHCDLMVF